MSEATQPGPATAAGPSAGTLLRQAREAAGLHVAALAASLKVPVRKLEALEQDRYDQLPDLVFARALASSICRTLKVDAGPVLERLPQGSTPRLAGSADSINAPFRAPGDAVAPRWLDHFRRPVVLLVAALLLGAVVLLALPAFHGLSLPGAGDNTQATATPGAAAPSDAASAAPAAMAVGTQPAVEPATAASAAGQPVPLAVPLEPAPAAATAPAAAAPGSAATTPSPAASAAAPAGPAVVVFRTSAPSWVQVTDADGKVALRRELAAGETASAGGRLPLAVTVGNARATTVEVRGQPRDLGPLARDNVARFDIK